MTCTKCHKEEAEWFGLTVDDLCQDCFEDWCNQEFWKAVDEGKVI